jgi:hypothetical protein
MWKYLADAMRQAEPADRFAQRVLDELEQGAPFYWLTHDKTVAAIDQRHRALTIERMPPTVFEDMP